MPILIYLNTQGTELEKHQTGVEHARNNQICMLRLSSLLKTTAAITKSSPFYLIIPPIYSSFILLLPEWPRGPAHLHD